MGMTREGNRIGVLAQYLCHIAVIPAPSPGAVASVLGMRMLDIEERLLLAQLGGTFGQEVSQAGNVVVMPVCTDEAVSVDLLHPYGRVFLLEASLPRALQIVADTVLLDIVGTILADGSAPIGSLCIVVAVYEQLLCIFPVKPLVVGEHLIPSIGHHLQLGFQSLVGHIACYYHSVHPLASEVFQSMYEDIGRLAPTQVDVAYDTYDKVGITQSLEVCSQRWNTHIGCSHQCC